MSGAINRAEGWKARKKGGKKGRREGGREVPKGQLQPKILKGVFENLAEAFVVLGVDGLGEEGREGGREDEDNRSGGRRRRKKGKREGGKEGGREGRTSMSRCVTGAPRMCL